MFFPNVRVLLLSYFYDKNRVLLQTRFAQYSMLTRCCGFQGKSSQTHALHQPQRAIRGTIQIAIDKAGDVQKDLMEKQERPLLERDAVRKCDVITCVVF